MDVIAIGGNNAVKHARVATFAKSSVVELMGRPYFNVLYQKRFIPQNINLYIKLVLFSNNFMCKLTKPCQNAQQKNFKRYLERQFHYLHHTAH